MKNNPYTPGPWKIVDGELFIGGHSTGASAADFSNGVQDYPEALANLTLASAAPEMLEALRSLVSIPAFNGFLRANGAHQLRKAWEAITKAEGR